MKIHALAFYIALVCILAFLCVMPQQAHAADADINPPGVGTCLRRSTPWTNGSISTNVGSLTLAGCRDALNAIDPGWPEASVYVADVYNSSGCLTSIYRTAAAGTNAWGYIWNPPTPYCPPPPDPDMCSLDSPPVFYIETSPSLLNYTPDAMVCGGTCLYAYNNSFFNDADGSVQNNYVPTQSECSGEETPRELDTATRDSIDVEDHECDTYENVIMCYPAQVPPYSDQRGDPSKCYVDGGATEIECPPDTTNSETGDDKRCGFVAGDYFCLDTDSDKTCGMANGKLVCFPKSDAGDPAPVPVAPDSPDHPLRGGNADGNETNDVFGDAADAAANGLSDADVQKELQRQGIADAYRNASGSRGGTAGGGSGDGFDDTRIVNAINDVNERLEGGLSLAPVDGLEVRDLEDLTDAFEDLNTSIGTVGTASELTMDGSGVEAVGGIVAGIVPVPTSCQTIDFLSVAGTELDMSVDTCMLATPRAVLEWVFYALTVWSLFSMVTYRGRT